MYPGLNFDSFLDRFIYEPTALSSNLEGLGGRSGEGFWSTTLGGGLLSWAVEADFWSTEKWGFINVESGLHIKSVITEKLGNS